jgi:hypothetical protein
VSRPNEPRSTTIETDRRVPRRYSPAVAFGQQSRKTLWRHLGESRRKTVAEYLHDR